MMAFRRFLGHVLPDVGDQERLRVAMGRFFDRDKRGALILCGNGAGSRLMLRVIEEVMGAANTGFVPCCDMAGGSRCLAGLIDVGVNVVMDLTCGASWSMYNKLLRRLVVDGVLFEGDVVRAPSMVFYSRFVPDAGVLGALAKVVTVIEFKVLDRVSFLWSDLAAEVESIRGWVRGGLGDRFRRTA